MSNRGTSPITGPLAECVDCRHFHPGERFEGGWTCNAFPHGIPATIGRGERSHREPYPGDGGVMFVPMRAGQGRIPYGEHTPNLPRGVPRHPTAID